MDTVDSLYVAVVRPGGFIKYRSLKKNKFRGFEGINRNQKQIKNSLIKVSSEVFHCPA